MKLQVLAVSLGLVVAGGSAYAQTPGPASGKGPGHGADRLKAADTNGDKMISRAEAQASLPRIAENFDKIDANRDGQLSQEEMRQWSEQRRAAMQAERERRFKAADKDGDNHISRAEAEASMPMVAKRFDVLDANGDGKLTREELASGGRAHAKGPGRPHG